MAMMISQMIVSLLLLICIPIYASFFPSAALLSISENLLLARDEAEAWPATCKEMEEIQTERAQKKQEQMAIRAKKNPQSSSLHASVSSDDDADAAAPHSDDEESAAVTQR